MSQLTRRLRERYLLMGKQVSVPAGTAGMEFATERGNIAGLILEVEEQEHLAAQANARVAELEKALQDAAVQMQDLARDARGYEIGYWKGAEYQLHVMLALLGAEQEDAEFEAGAGQSSEQREWHVEFAAYLGQAIARLRDVAPDPWALDMLYRENQELQRRVVVLEEEQRMWRVMAAATNPGNPNAGGGQKLVGLPALTVELAEQRGGN